jgi:hypothetical protein
MDILPSGQKVEWTMLGFLRRRTQLAACVLAIPGTAFAATQGTLGATSTGSVSIGATIPGRAQISGLTDVAFGTVDPTVPASSAENVCVWSNTSGRGYQVTATGSGAANAFTLTSGTGTLAYSVEWAGSSGQLSGTGLTSGTALTALSSTATSPTCAAGPAASASLVVKMTAANLQAAVASTYNGTLTVVVAPQ